MTEGLEEYMLPCLNKKLFGIECLGCGLQRSVAFLFKGEFIAAFKMYPAIYTLIIFGGFLLLNIFYNFKHSEKIKIALLVVNIVLILGSFLYKLLTN